jgi:DNA-binding MarR family transcriptional regulator
MTKKGSSSGSPSRRSTKLSPFEREFPGASESANGLVIDLFHTYDAVLTLINQGVAFLGLSSTGRQALAVIEGARAPLSPTVISQRLLVTTASVTSLLDTLERRGLVVRLPDPDDRRKLLVQITAEGQQLVDSMLPKVVALQAAAMADLSEEDRERMREALAVIRGTIDVVDVEAVVSAAKPRVMPKRD